LQGSMVYNRTMTINDPNLENTRAQMRKGLLEYCIMLTIARAEAYASDILKQLKEDDLIVVEGTLYPLLSRLRVDGLLDYVWKESNAGPPRKYYSLTPTGRKTLEQLKTTWDQLTKSINSLIKKHEPRNTTFSK